jgi:hypothetical protein
MGEERGEVATRLAASFVLLAVAEPSKAAVRQTTWNNVEISIFSAHYSESFKKYAYYLAGNECNAFQ